ncbi:MAG: DUF4886 domain-containing protein [Clostridia bacterium]|nr:DUF4886 domain-containing protein [Clostridia bacterium]
MKRLIALLLAALMFASLFACSKEEEPKAEPAETTEEETTVITATEEITTSEIPVTTTKASTDNKKPTTTTKASTGNKTPTTTTKSSTENKTPTTTTKAPTNNSTTEKPKEPTVEVEKSFGQKIRDSVTPVPLFSVDPDQDNEFNVLLIGNSYSTHWPDELAFLFGAAGYKNVTICNIYHSGAVFQDHWTWFQNGENKETLHINRPGQNRISWENVGWEECIDFANWDVISFQQGNELVGATERYYDSIDKWLPQIFTYVYKQFPKAQYYWQQNWSHEAGNGSYTLDRTKRHGNWHREVALKVSGEWDFINVPLGSAWMSVRHDPLFYEGTGAREDTPTRSLTRRIQKSGVNTGLIVDDLSHDGDIGGGSYLNACVWFEMLTHKSVLSINTAPVYQDGAGNTYTLTQEQIKKLQNTAHQTVLADYGGSWYR